MDTKAIEALETSAGQAGDTLMAAICQIALNGEPNGLTVSACTPSEQARLFQLFADQSTPDSWDRESAVAECETIIHNNG